MSRYSDDEILKWINDAILRIRRFRPDSALNVDGNMYDFFQVTATSDDIPINDEWRMAITYYACFRLLSESVENKLSMKRSRHFKKKFNEQVLA